MPVAQPKPKQHKKLSTITNRLDTLVSKIVRLRDAQCITCGSVEEGECGHYFHRALINTRWDLQNCHRQCTCCNSYHEENTEPYTRFMIQKYGPEVIIELSQIAHSPKKINRVDRLILEVEFKKLLSELEASYGVD